MTKLIVDFRNFANAPTNSALCPHGVTQCFVRISKKKKTGTLGPQNINWLVFVTETEYVY